MRGHQSRNASQRVRSRACQRIRCNYRRLGGSWPPWHCQIPISSPGFRVIKPTKGELASGEPVGALGCAWKNPAKCDVKTVPSTSTSASACGLNETADPRYRQPPVGYQFAVVVLELGRDDTRNMQWSLFRAHYEKNRQGQPTM